MRSLQSSSHVLHESLPPASVTTTDWSVYPLMRALKLIDDATYFLLRITGNSKGLYRALEEMMDVAGVYGERYDYTGLKNHRRLLDAVGKIQRGTTDRMVADFWLSPKRIRQREMEEPPSGLALCASYSQRLLRRFALLPIVQITKTMARCAECRVE